MKRILVTGASGMLGSSLAIELSSAYNVFATGNSKMSLPVNYKIFDLSNESYKEIIAWSEPELIIHCAALTNGNYCQNNVLETFNVNGCSTKKLMDASENHVKIIYISTDAVFPSHIKMAKEIDNTSAESIYGKSKELGEFFLLNSDRDFLIIRTTIVGLNNYRDKIGFVEWILNSEKEKKLISLFDDVLFTPISIWELIEEISYLIVKGFSESKVLHIAGAEAVTKYEFGKALLDECFTSFKFVKKGFISEYKNRAKRSNDQTLDSSLYEKRFKRKLPNIKQTINIIKLNLQ